jgi:hypothetical protein
MLPFPLYEITKQLEKNMVSSLSLTAAILEKRKTPV